MEKECKNCKKKFEKHNKKKGDFCSSRCSDEYKKWNNEPNSKCPICGISFYKKPSQKLKTKTDCCSIKCSNKNRSIKMTGTSNHQYGIKGENNSSFKNCETVNSAGYILVYNPEHPYANSNGRVLKHRIVAESKLLSEFNSIMINGKLYLNKDFDVHHLDFDKQNNNIENLLVLTRAQHTILHTQIRNAKK